MLLRRFYMFENSNGECFDLCIHVLLWKGGMLRVLTSAPVPKKKTTRVLKTDIPPPPSSGTNTPKTNAKPSPMPASGYGIPPPGYVDDLLPPSTMGKDALPVGTTVASTPLPRD